MRGSEGERVEKKILMLSRKRKDKKQISGKYRRTKSMRKCNKRNKRNNYWH